MLVTRLFVQEVKNKRDSAKKDWCFTLNNYDENQNTEMERILIDESVVRYAIYGKEVGRSGTPHLQGYLCLVKKQRFDSVKKLFGIDQEGRNKGTHDQARDYCKKDGNFKEFGIDEGGASRRSDLTTAASELREGKSIKDIALDHPVTYIRNYRGLHQYLHMIQEPVAVDGLRGHWFHGKSGVGKTRSSTGKHPNCYKKPQNKWWDGYAGESVVCMEDVDNLNEGMCHLLKNWTDRYPVTGESKGGTVPLQHTAFVITSNFTIEELVNSQVAEGKREQMLEALERRFIQYELKREWIPVGVENGKVATGDWITTSTPPLPDVFGPHNGPLGNSTTKPVEFETVV